MPNSQEFREWFELILRVPAPFFWFLGISVSLVVSAVGGAFFLGRHFCWQIASSRIEGLQAKLDGADAVLRAKDAELNAKDERLKLATDRHNDIERKLAEVTQAVERGETNKARSGLKDLAIASTALHGTLTPGLVGYGGKQFLSGETVPSIPQQQPPRRKK